MPCAACGKKYIRAKSQSTTVLVAPLRIKSSVRRQRVKTKRGVVLKQPQPENADVVSDPRKGLVDPSTGMEMKMLERGESGEAITNKTSSGPGFVNRYPEVKDA